MGYQLESRGSRYAWARTLGTFMIVFGVFLAVILTYGQIVCKYNYQKRYSSHWHLADKSSTIPAKETHINAFVKALKDGKARGEFSDNNAIFLKTPDNNFDANYAAVETLAQRLKEIQQMDPKSFEYNTAIQQITEQEQGEAHKLMAVFYGCYELSNYFYVWGWIGGVVMTLMVCCIVGGICLFGFWLDNRHRY